MSMIRRRGTVRLITRTLKVCRMIAHGAFLRCWAIVLRTSALQRTMNPQVAVSRDFWQPKQGHTPGSILSARIRPPSKLMQQEGMTGMSLCSELWEFALAHISKHLHRYTYAYTYMYIHRCILLYMCIYIYKHI